jgi:hypothetical protein
MSHTDCSGQHTLRDPPRGGACTIDQNRRGDWHVEDELDWLAPASNLKPSVAIAPTETGIASMLASADWLDTIIDEMLESSPKKIAAKARSPGAATCLGGVDFA